jgi:hypothetical protein
VLQSVFPSGEVPSLRRLCCFPSPAFTASRWLTWRTLWATWRCQLRVAASAPVLSFYRRLHRRPPSV